MSQGDVPVPTVVAMIAFVRAVPATEPILDQHRATNRAIVPQLLMADLRHFVVSVVACNERVLVADLLAEIERLASSDDHSVRELVQTGFIRALVAAVHRNATRSTRSEIWSVPRPAKPSALSSRSTTPGQDAVASLDPPLALPE